MCRLYDQWARTYDADPNATRDLDQQVLASVLGDLRFQSVIELGCGTGKNTELLSRIGRKVHALDFSPGMLAKARAKAPSNVTLSVADICQRWPSKRGSADLVVCNLVLEHIADLAPVFTEAARVLTRDGLFFVSELHPFRQYGGVVAKFQRGARTRKIPAFVHHVSDFLSCGDEAGFRLFKLQEWWHKKDRGKPPRLVTFLFENRRVQPSRL